MLRHPHNDELRIRQTMGVIAADTLLQVLSLVREARRLRAEEDMTIATQHAGSVAESIGQEIAANADKNP